MKRKTDVNDTNVVNINRRIFNNKTINMEQKFKVGDSVKVNKGDGIFYYGTIERVFETYCQVVSDFNRSTLFPSNSRIELRYPSDHDLLDFAARDSKIAELTAENEALKAELEKYKPKPESKDVELYLYRDLYLFYGQQH